jgi:hypothetical protein
VQKAKPDLLKTVAKGESTLRAAEKAVEDTARGRAETPQRRVPGVGVRVNGRRGRGSREIEGVPEPALQAPKITLR